MIPLDRIKPCANPSCRLMLPADPTNELGAGFWVREREGGPGTPVRRFQSWCKDCVRARRGKGMRRRAISWTAEYEGRLVMFRRCVNETCGAEGPCLDSPESTFFAKGRDENRRVIQWSIVCRDCYNRDQRERPRESEKSKARRRARYRWRMENDPDFAEQRRAAGRGLYAASAERRRKVRIASARHSKRRWKENPRQARELERIDRALRVERRGGTRRKRSKTVIDRVERVLIDKEPLLIEMERWWRGNRGDAADGDHVAGWEQLAELAGTDERSITRLRSDKGRYVRTDLGDKLAVALGHTLGSIYRDPLFDLARQRPRCAPAADVLRWMAAVESVLEERYG